jgi:hypothetical protein
VVMSEEKGVGQEITLQTLLSLLFPIDNSIAMCWDRVLLAGHLHNPLLLPPCKGEKWTRWWTSINLRPSPWRAARGEY